MADLSQFLYQQEPVEAPQGVRVPWQGLPPARADQMRQKAYEDAQRTIADNANVVSQGADVLNQLETFLDYNREAETGEFYTGFLPEFLTGKEEQMMNSISADVAPKKRIAGSGTTSDKDIAMYMQSLPSIEKKGTVNQKIVQNYRTQYDRAEKKLKFLQSYFDQYGHLNGVDAQWQKMTALEKQPKGNQPAPVNKKAPVNNNQPKSKVFQLDDGKSITGILGDDGNYYTTRGGTKFRVME
jgi:hypothetical protein